MKHEDFDILTLYVVLSSPYEPGEFIDMVNRVLQTAFLKEAAVGTGEKLIEQGKKEGRREGVLEERRKTAARVFAREFSVEEIAEITGLTEAEVRAIGRPEQD